MKYIGQWEGRGKDKRFRVVTASGRLVGYYRSEAEADDAVRPMAEPIALPVRTVPPELLPLALDIQAARVQAEVDGSLRQRMTNVRTDERKPEERRVR